ncbi:hypothetical protein HNY73_017348 [Argiope bruennichi]|uniref:Uncharacterized protein n=1 Tax=Argiope bruennichi TaxID=94029 RepID=A0A8T0ELR5_ARGBR|nr:hypothetical protein HNY73_017348 [Argiope bruennichi]
MSTHAERAVSVPEHGHLVRSMHRHLSPETYIKYNVKKETRKIVGCIPSVLCPLPHTNTSANLPSETYKNTMIKNKGSTRGEIFRPMPTRKCPFSRARTPLRSSYSRHLSPETYIKYNVKKKKQEKLSDVFPACCALYHTRTPLPIYHLNIQIYQ